MELAGQMYLLRWRFDFHGRASVFGMWNSDAIKAWDKNREGLARASIEGKDIVTAKTVVLVECDGHDFRNFQWIAIARVNPALRGAVSPRPENIGLKILTENEEVAVLVNGQVGRRLLTGPEKGIQFATFGR